MSALCRDVTNAHKSKFFQDDSTRNKRRATYYLSQDKEDERMLGSINQKVNSVLLNIQFEDVENLPEQLVREFSRAFESELLEESTIPTPSRQPHSIVKARSELQFFNWSLLDLMGGSSGEENNN